MSAASGVPGESERAAGATTIHTGKERIGSRVGAADLCCHGTCLAKTLSNQPSSRPEPGPPSGEPRAAENTLSFKESVSANPAEGAVHHLLSQYAPDQVTPPVGWNDSRGWLLTNDGDRTIFDTNPKLRGGPTRSARC